MSYHTAAYHPACHCASELFHYFCLLNRDNSFGALGWYKKVQDAEFARDFIELLVKRNQDSKQGDNRMFL